MSHGFSFGIQGRYFFPVISALTALLVFGVLGFTDKKRLRQMIVVFLGLSMIVLHQIALFWLLFSYYSKESVSLFFVQASQYKPWFFKSPVLEFLILVHFISLGIFVFNYLKQIKTYEKA